ncbi:MAG: hypothetical protein WCC10_15370, partial [Tumebacillaceae bacterium]
GLQWFEYCRTIIPPIPENIGRNLLDYKDHLCEEFSKQNGLHVGATDAVFRLQEIICSHREQGNELEWKFIEGAGAFFGEHLRRSLGGQWQWNFEFSEPIITEIGGRTDISIHPLFSVLRNWCNPYNKLLTIYGYLVHVLLNNMPYLGR